MWLWLCEQRTVYVYYRNVGVFLLQYYYYRSSLSRGDIYTVLLQADEYIICADDDVVPVSIILVSFLPSSSFWGDVFGFLVSSLRSCMIAFVLLYARVSRRRRPSSTVVEVFVQTVQYGTVGLTQRIPRKMAGLVNGHRRRLTREGEAGFPFGVVVDDGTPHALPAGRRTNAAVIIILYVGCFLFLRNGPTPQSTSSERMRHTV